MSRALVLIAALGAGLPVAVSARTVQGVDFDTVPWATFCPSIESGGSTQAPAIVRSCIQYPPSTPDGTTWARA